MLMSGVLFGLALLTTTAASESPAPEVAAPAVADSAPAPSIPTPVTPAATEKSAFPDWLSRLDLSGVAFLNYSYNLSKGGKDFHTFDVTRAYLTLQARPLDHVRLKMTIDAPSREPLVTVSSGTTSVRDAVGRLDVVLKHAYGEVYDLFIDGLSVRLGMQDSPWISGTEKMWGYRYTGALFFERSGYLTSTDLGVGVFYAMPEKWLDAHIVLSNGETWQRAETTKHKDVQARLTVRPLATSELFSGLTVAVGGNLGKYEMGQDKDRHRLMAQLAYLGKHLYLSVDYLRGWDPASKLATRYPSLTGFSRPMVEGQAISASAWLDLGMFGVLEGVRVVGRFDTVDAAAGVRNNDLRRQMFGIGYVANKYVSVLVDAELTQYDANAGAPGAEPPVDEQRIYLHTMIGF